MTLPKGASTTSLKFVRTSFVQSDHCLNIVMPVLRYLKVELDQMEMQSFADHKTHISDS